MTSQTISGDTDVGTPFELCLEFRLPESKIISIINREDLQPTNAETAKNGRQLTYRVAELRPIIEKQNEIKQQVDNNPDLMTVRQIATKDEIDYATCLSRIHMAALEAKCQISRTQYFSYEEYKTQCAEYKKKRYVSTEDESMLAIEEVAERLGKNLPDSADSFEDLNFVRKLLKMVHIQHMGYFSPHQKAFAADDVDWLVTHINEACSLSENEKQLKQEA